MTPTQTIGRRARAFAAGLALCLAAVAAAAPGASAAGLSFQVDACGNGHAVPPSWASAGTGPQDKLVYNRGCQGVGGSNLFQVRSTSLAQTVPGFTGGSWRATAVPGTKLTYLDWKGQFDADGGGWSAGVGTNAGWTPGAWCNGTYTACSMFFPYNSPPDHTALGSADWVSAGFICGLISCPTGSGSSYYAFAGLTYAKITVRDDTDPGIVGTGPVWGNPGWQQNPSSVGYNATDNTGIKTIAMTVDGNAVTPPGGVGFPCDYTLMAPCSNRSGSLALPPLSDGTHTLKLGAWDAAGNLSTSETSIKVDNHPPAAPAAPAVAGGQTWRSTNGFDLSWTNPSPGSGSSIDQIAYRLCDSNGQNCGPTQLDSSAGAIAASATLTGVTAPLGDNTVMVAARDAAGWGPWSAATTHLRYDPASGLGAPDFALNGWINRQEGVPITYMGSYGPSGIAGYHCTIDGSDPTTSSPFVAAAQTPPWAATLDVSAFPNGTTTVKCRTKSGSGVLGDLLTQEVKVDKDAPSIAATGLPDPGAWQRTPVTVGLHATDALSGMAAANPYDHGGYVSWAIDGGPEQHQAGPDATVTLPADGNHTLSFWATDLAGNRSIVHSATVRVDTHGPNPVAFEAPDPNNPRRISVVAVDLASGVASGQVQISRAGSGQWHNLPTSVGGVGLVAFLDDAAYPPGAYHLRAIATDGAGNTTISDRMTADAGGGSAIWQLPIRLRTVLSAVASHKRAVTCKTATVKVRKRVRGKLVTVKVRKRVCSVPRVACRTVRVRVKLRQHGKTVTRTVKRRHCKRVGKPKPIRMRVPFDGGSIPTSGLLTTADGQPLAGRVVRIVSTPANRSVGRARVARVRTDRNGQFSYRSGGPSRVLRFLFDGSDALAPASARGTVAVLGKGSFTASRRVVQVRQRFTFSGRVYGGYLPVVRGKVGKLVELQYRLPGQRWGRFGTVRTNKAGVWRQPWAFSARYRGMHISFRARLLSEDGWGYETVLTPVTVVRIR